MAVLEGASISLASAHAWFWKLVLLANRLHFSCVCAKNGVVFSVKLLIP